MRHSKTVDMPYKATVILTTYNRKKMLRQSINSVIGQTMSNWELIIGDDNSSDGTKDMVLMEYGDDARIKYFKTDVKDEDRLKKCRYSVLINHALRMAQGQYIAYLVDDDIYFPRKLEKTTQELDRRPNISVVYNDQNIAEINDELETKFIKKRIFHFKKTKLLNRNFIDHCSVVHRKECVDEIGYWNEDFSQVMGADHDYWKRLVLKYDFFFRIPMVLEESRQHSHSIQCYCKESQTYFNKDKLVDLIKEINSKK